MVIRVCGCECVCGCLCGGSGGVLAYVGLSFDDGMKLYGEKHPPLHCHCMENLSFFVLLTGVVGGDCIHTHIQIPERTQSVNTL